MIIKSINNKRIDIKVNINLIIFNIKTKTIKLIYCETL